MQKNKKILRLYYQVNIDKNKMNTQKVIFSKYLIINLLYKTGGVKNSLLPKVFKHYFIYTLFISKLKIATIHWSEWLVIAINKIVQSNLLFKKQKRTRNQISSFVLTIQSYLLHKCFVYHRYPYLVNNNYYIIN